MNSEDRGSAAQILVMRLEDPENVVLLELCQCNPSAGLRRRLYRGGLNRLWQVLGKNHRMRSQRNRALDGMFKFPDVPRPPIAVKQRHGLRSDAVHRRRFLVSI